MGAPAADLKKQDMIESPRNMLVNSMLGSQRAAMRLALGGLWSGPRRAGARFGVLGRLAPAGRPAGRPEAEPARR